MPRFRGKRRGGPASKPSVVHIELKGPAKAGISRIVTMCRPDDVASVRYSYSEDDMGHLTKRVGTEIYITDDYRYVVCDPEVDERDIEVINDKLNSLFITIDVDKIIDYVTFDYTSGGGLDAEAVRIRNINNLFQLFKNELSFDDVESSVDHDTLIYLIIREIYGYGKLDPLIEDPNIQDIIVSRPGKDYPVKVIHKEYGVLETNIYFDDDELDEYIEKIFNRINKSISLFSPLASVQLPEGHRLTVSYKREVTTGGSSMIIRKFPKNPWSISQLLLHDAIEPEVAAFLMLAIRYKLGIIVAGAMGTGKTSMMNGLMNFIPEKATIVTIEDTPELRLPHKYWIQHVTRESSGLGGSGSITLFDLVKHALRESADYVIIGEIRGEEGREWAQALATGHGGLTTFHAESANAVIYRLTTEPINVEPSILSSLKLIGLMRRFDREKVVTINGVQQRVRVYERQLTELYEVIYNSKLNRIELNPLYFRYGEDEYNINGFMDRVKNSMIIRDLSRLMGLSTSEILEFLGEGIRYLTMLKQHVEANRRSKYLNYSEVTKLTWMFYESPQRVYSILEEGLLARP